MKYDADENRFILSTGRTLSANGEFALALRDGEVSHGYDGYSYADIDDPDAVFTPEERQEIARYMTDAWRRWAETGEP